MKKLFALMTVLCLLCCCALAETAETSWEQVEEFATATYPGEIKPLGVYSLGMYVPDSFHAVEVTDEQRAAGVYFILEDDNGCRVSGTYQSLGDNGVDYLIDELTKAGATDLTEIIMNEIPAINYDLVINEVQTSNLLFFNANDNTFLTLSFGPTDNEDFRPISSIMVASIQLVSEAE